MSIFKILKTFLITTQNETYRHLSRELIVDFQKDNLQNQNKFAVKTFVSEPTVTRFAQALGFSGYKELRFRLQLEIDKGGNIKREEQVTKYNFNFNRIRDICIWLENHANFFLDLINEIIKHDELNIISSHYLQKNSQYLSDLLFELGIKTNIFTIDYRNLNHKIKKLSDSLPTLILLYGEESKPLVNEYLPIIRKSKQPNAFFLIQQSKFKDITISTDYRILVLRDDDEYFSALKHLAFDMVFFQMASQIQSNKKMNQFV